MDYNSKYTGEQVEELLDKINGSPEDIAIPTGNYPDMTVGKASQADTATRAINADNATKAASATTADRATQATTADKATTADYATTAGQATTAESAKTATNADRATTAEYATTAGVAESAEHAATASLATRATVADSAESATHAGAATKADFATDLTGRNEATAEEFTLRPSAGNKSIRDDSAIIKRIKGNSVVWNQLSQVFPHDNTRSAHGVSVRNIAGTHYLECSGTTTAIEGNGYIYVDSDIFPKVNGVSGHKYIFLVEGCENLQINLYKFVSPSKQITNGGTIVTCTKNELIRYSVSIPTSTPVGTTINEKIRVLYIDLTQMFGPGNEPDTVEEFKALFPDNYYEYNPGQLVSMTANGLFTNGFNQWDEQWEVGYLNADGTTAGYVQNYIRAKNYIPVISGEKYYAKLPNGVSDAQLYAVDENYNFIKQIYSWINNQFIIPDGAAYIRFYMKYGSEVYNNDICINLSHTGVENGKYEPYWDATKDLSVIQKYFPNGMRSAGSIYDEISFDETTQKWVAIQRVGTVDLGSLSWSQNPDYGFYVSIGELFGMQNVTSNNIAANILCTKYITGRAVDIFTQTKTNSIAVSTTHLVVGDLTYNNSSAFKTAMSGVMLNYELAEPIITVIEEPINLSYKVGDFGIEQILSDSFSAPFRADIIYQFNATDRIRENSLNIEKLSKTQNEYLPLTGGTMSGQINSQDIKPVEDSTYQLGDSTHKYKNVFSDFFTGNLEGNAKTATVASDLSGRVEATPEVFTYHPSAGDKSIKDNNAFIRRVKGNSVVWNQLVDNNTLFIGEKNGMVISKNEDGSITFNGTSSADIYYNLVNLSIPIGHKVALTGVDNMSPFTFFINGGIGNALTSSGILTCSHIGTNGNGWMFLYITANTTFNNVTINPKIHYLTRMFGIGNEPTTVEEFRVLYPDSYYPYNVGELRNLVCSGIRTVGFNLFDEDVMTSWSGITKDNRGWYGNVSSFYRDSSNNRNKLWVNTMGYTGQICVYIKSTAVDARTNFRPQIHYIDGTTNSYDDSVVLSGEKTSAEGYIVSDENKVVDFVGFSYGTIGYVIVNNFCINLHHTGYRDGDYEPYKEVTHALPLSQITNGEPLRKAGSVYDEINETHYIKRVGVVDLGSLAWSINTASPRLFWSNKLDDATLFGYSDIPNLTCTIDVLPFSQINTGTENISISLHNAQKRVVVCAPNFETTEAGIAALKASLSGVLLHYELAEPIVTPIETHIDFNYYVEDFGTEEALLAEDSAPFSADIVYQFNATDQIRNNTRNIQKLQKSALIPKGTSSQYIRGDGSYGDIVELSQSTPINNGEFEITDEGNRQFILTPNYYAKSQVTLDNTTTIAVFVTAPENSHYLAEYWFEFAVDDTLPNIEYYQPNNSDAVFRIDGDMMTGAVNILHLISSDGGNKFFGEIRSYSL